MTDQERVMLIETEQRSKSNGHRIDKLEDDIEAVKEEQKAIYKLVTSVELIAQRVGHIEEKVDDTNKKVNEQREALLETEKRLTEKINDSETQPYKDTATRLTTLKWALITAICTLVLSGVVTAVVSFIR